MEEQYPLEGECPIFYKDLWEMAFIAKKNSGKGTRCYRTRGECSSSSSLVSDSDDLAMASFIQKLCKDPTLLCHLRDTLNNLPPTETLIERHEERDGRVDGDEEVKCCSVKMNLECVVLFN